MSLLADHSATVGSPAEALRCRNCGASFPLGPVHACFECFGPLEIGYDPAAIARVTAADIEAGPRSIWRYAGLLPVGQDPATRVTLDPGCTPLVRADRLAAELGMRDLWVKDDSANPTHSFKDRVVSVALTAARQLGFTRVACASTGNLANSVAAHAARAGLDSVVLVPADLEPAKIVQTAVYGGTLVAVTGSYDDVNRLCAELAETDAFYSTAFVNVNVRPYYAEGSKTLGYEVAEQLGWRLPRQVVIPAASGSLLTKVDKAFAELVRIGLVPAADWAVFGAQSSGCAPISTAFSLGRDVVEPVRPTGDRQVAEHRQPGRRAVRAGRRAAQRGSGRGRRGRGDPGGHRAARPDHRDLRGDRRRGGGGGAAQAARRRRARPGRRDRAAEHRGRPEDARRGRRPAGADRHRGAVAALRARGRPARLTALSRRSV